MKADSRFAFSLGVRHRKRRGATLCGVLARDPVPRRTVPDCRWCALAARMAAYTDHLPKIKLDSRI